MPLVATLQVRLDAALPRNYWNVFPARISKVDIILLGSSIFPLTNNVKAGFTLPYMDQLFVANVRLGYLLLGKHGESRVALNELPTNQWPALERL